VENLPWSKASGGIQSSGISLSGPAMSVVIVNVRPVLVTDAFLVRRSEPVTEIPLRFY
jgi:hypothetical protein